MKVSYTKHLAPPCSYPDCRCKVGYHEKYTREDGTPGFKWKNFCEYHRDLGKFSVDNWKLHQGCSNTDAHYGFVCTATIFSAEQLDINHIDGNRHNQSPSNIEVLCKNCHAKVTIDQGHHKNRYPNKVPLDKNLFEE
jgi:5-methylcytosine-specific restriction endonuclease McrA